jgi:putative transposase
LPRDYGSWKTVYHYFRLWSQKGYWQAIHDVFRGVVRNQAGKRSQPTAAILDSQTVRSSDQAGERGYDAAKKTEGIKRRVLVDTLGLLLAVCVTKADVPEREGARRLLARALAFLRCLWADQGYGGDELAGWVAAQRKTGALRLGGRAAPQRPAWLPSVAQTMDRRTDFGPVYETSPAGAPLRS